MNVLVLNSGSSSLKFQLIATDLARIEKDSDERLCRGEVERIGGASIATIQALDHPKQTGTVALKDLAAALDYVVQETTDLAEIHAVGHRVVHGSERFSESVLITPEVLRGIEDCAGLAPLHNPGNIEGIRAARKSFGDRVPQVAVFDTAFHQSLPEHAYLYALPYHLYERHRIRRYGFHGISHRYAAQRYRILRSITREQTNVVTLHLGNGCSAAAIRGGQSVDTSMGMTPLEGLVMGTRCGDIDPALVNLIAAKEGLSAQEVDTLLNSQSGLLGVSGVSNDMRTLLQERDSPQAQRAIEIFCYRGRKYIGAFLAGMGGADAVLFTGGIGENSPEIRERICDGLQWAGLHLDRDRNQRAAGVEARISADGASLAAYVIPANEELLIARDTVRCVAGETHAT